MTPLICAQERMAELAALEVESIGWVPLGEGLACTSVSWKLWLSLWWAYPTLRRQIKPCCC